MVRLSRATKYLMQSLVEVPSTQVLYARSHRAAILDDQNKN